MYEQLRLRTERHALTGKTPRVLLAEFGDAKMRAARSNFAANFFACAGFDLVAKRFSVADRIPASDPDLIVLCSSDPEYLALAIEVIEIEGAWARDSGDRRGQSRVEGATAKRPALLISFISGATPSKFSQNGSNGWGSRTNYASRLFKDRIEARSGPSGCAREQDAGK
jgi:hypothetical protein